MNESISLSIIDCVLWLSLPSSSLTNTKEFPSSNKFTMEFIAIPSGASLLETEAMGVVGKRNRSDRTVGGILVGMLVDETGFGVAILLSTSS